VNPEEYYAAFIELVKCYSENTIENSVYEDTLREMFSTKAYYAYTMDKLIHQLVKVIFEIIKENARDNSVLIHHSFKLGRAPYRQEGKPHLITANEIPYRKKIEENLIDDEFLFRITVTRSNGQSEVGIELCNIEDGDDEGPKSAPECVEPPFPPGEIISPSPLFLKRNLLRVKLSSRGDREKKFTNQPQAISMVPLPNKLARGKIKYTANKSESFHIPGCLARSKISYKEKDSYAIKKHSKFRSWVQKWIISNGSNDIFKGENVVLKDCYFGKRKIYN